MGKVISLRRRELVWEEYHREWTAKDFDELKEWISTRTEDPHYATRYAAIKDVSFDELCDMISGKLPDVEWKIQCGDGENSWVYRESIVDYITELMREDAWDYGCTDSWGADDSEEDVNIYE